MTDGQAYRATLGEDENDEAKALRDRYEADINALNMEYGKVQNEFAQRNTRIAAKPRRSPSPKPPESGAVSQELQSLL